MSDYADTMSRDQFADLAAAVDGLSVAVNRIALFQRRNVETLELLINRLDSIERSMDIAQTLDVKGAARLVGVSVDTIYRDKALRAIALSSSPLRWRRSDVLAEIDRRAGR